MLNEDIDYYKNKPISAESLPDKLFYSYKKRVISNAYVLSNEKLLDIQDAGIAGVNFYYSVSNPPYYQRIPGSVKELRCKVPRGGPYLPQEGKCGVK